MAGLFPVSEGTKRDRPWRTLPAMGLDQPLWRAVFVFRLAPETKNRPLEDIRLYWENGGKWPADLPVGDHHLAETSAR